MARQIGFSTALAFEAMCSALFDRVDSLIVSASERNAQEVLLKVKKWTDVARAAGVDATVNSDSRSEVSFAGGGKILSLSQNPSTVRGFTGHVSLDEFAHHSEDRAIYDAILPVVSMGFGMRIVSTPFGQ